MDKAFPSHGARPVMSGQTSAREKDRGEENEKEGSSDQAILENRIVQLQVMVSSPNDPFSEEEAAAYLKLPVDSVDYYATRSGDLAYCDFGKGRRTYLRKDLDALLSRRRKPSIYEKDKARPQRKGTET